MLGEKIKRDKVNAVLDGELDDVPTTTDPVFGVAVPDSCPGIPEGLLDARSTWADGGTWRIADCRPHARFRLADQEAFLCSIFCITWGFAGFFVDTALLLQVIDQLIQFPVLGGAE